MSFALLVAVLAGQLPNWDEFRPWPGDQCVIGFPLMNPKSAGKPFAVEARDTSNGSVAVIGPPFGWKDLQEVAQLRQEYDAEHATVIGDAEKLAALRKKYVTEIWTRSHAEVLPSGTRGVCLASMQFNEAGQPTPIDEGPLPQGVILVEITEGRRKGRFLWITRMYVWSLTPRSRLPNLGDEPKKPAEEKQKDVGASPSQRATSRTVPR
jgi:hypothetical protein